MAMLACVFGLRKKLFVICPCLAASRAGPCRIIRVNDILFAERLLCLTKETECFSGGSDDEEL